MARVVVVGASVAGTAAARALRSAGFDGELVVVGAEPHRPYDRPPLSKDLLNGRVTPEQIALIAPDDEGLGITWMLGMAAVALVPSERAVVLESGRRVVADGVVLACGATARALPVPGAELGLHTLRTLDDALALRDALEAAGPVAIVGAGFIGLEVASAARSAGAAVTVVDVAPVPLAPVLGAQIGAAIEAWHRQNGVDFRLGVTVAGIEGGTRPEALRLGDGTAIDAATVVVGVGVRPATAWLAGSGVRLAGSGVGFEGPVICDPVGRSTIPEVVAIGDCSAWCDPLRGAPVHEEHWTAAFERPATAVDALLGRPAHPPAAPAYFWSDQHGARFQLVGHRGPGARATLDSGELGSDSWVVRYEEAGATTAVLAMNGGRRFTALRRALAADRKAKLVDLGLAP